MSAHKIYQSACFIRQEENKQRSFAKNRWVSNAKRGFPVRNEPRLMQNLAGRPFARAREHAHGMTGMPQS